MKKLVVIIVLCVLFLIAGVYGYHKNKSSDSDFQWKDSKEQLSEEDKEEQSYNAKVKALKRDLQDAIKENETIVVSPKDYTEYVATKKITVQIGTKDTKRFDEQTRNDIENFIKTQMECEQVALDIDEL